MQQDLPSLHLNPSALLRYLLMIEADYKCADSVHELVTETERSLLP